LTFFVGEAGFDSSLGLTERFFGDTDPFLGVGIELGSRFVDELRIRSEYKHVLRLY
jgi:hypothetical protein